MKGLALETYKAFDFCIRPSSCGPKMPIEMASSDIRPPMTYNSNHEHS